MLEWECRANAGVRGIHSLQFRGRYLEVNKNSPEKEVLEKVHRHVANLERINIQQWIKFEWSLVSLTNCCHQSSVRISR